MTVHIGATLDAAPPAEPGGDPGADPGKGAGLCGTGGPGEATADPSVLDRLRHREPLGSPSGFYCPACLGEATYLISKRVLAEEGPEAAARFLLWIAAHERPQP